jgi:arylsulfatase I/J
MTGKWDVEMATPDHSPLAKGYESFLGYYQHANDYWTKSSDLEATGQIDNCLSQFKDFFVINETYRGPVLDREQISGACRGSVQCAQTPTCPCYKEEIFKRQSLKAIAEYDLSTHASSPLFLFHSFGLLHTPLEVPTYFIDMISKIAEAAGGKFETRNQQLYAAMAL